MPTFGRPVFLSGVAVGFDKFEELLIGDQVFGRLKRINILLEVAVLVVPPVQLVGLRLPQLQCSTSNFDEFVRGSRSALFAQAPPDGVVLNMFQRQLTNKNRRRFQVDAFVFDPHQDDPHWTFPIDGH